MGYCLGYIGGGQRPGGGPGGQRGPSGPGGQMRQRDGGGPGGPGGPGGQRGPGGLVDPARMLPVPDRLQRKARPLIWPHLTSFIG